MKPCIALLAALNAASVAAQTSLGLDKNAKLSGRFFGTATDDTKFNDEQYVAILSDNEEFGWITTENQFKWGRTQPQQGIWDFTAADKVVNQGLSHGQKVRGHCLIWHIEQPAWLESGDWTPQQLDELMETHINKSMTPYIGKVAAWDVVNEVIADEPRGEMRTSFWYNILGAEYIDKAYHYAHAVDPEVELWINDYWVEASGPKADGYYELIQGMLSRGVPLHGVGFQCHFSVGRLPDEDDLRTNMQRFADLGLKISMLEIDLRIDLPVTQAKLEQQAVDYAMLARVCMSIDACVGQTVWDFS